VTKNSETKEWRKIRRKKEAITNVQEQISHCMFRKWQRNLKEEFWADLNIPESYAYDYGKGWFFGSTYDDRKKAELIEYKWMTENFNEGYIQSLINNPRYFWQVPVGESKIRAAKLDNNRQRQKVSFQYFGADYEEDVVMGADEGCQPRRKKVKLVEEAGRIICLGKDEYPTLRQVEQEWPDIQFRQGDENLCMFYSFASALSYMGLSRVASMVADQARKSLKKGTLVERLDVLQTTLVAHRDDLFDMNNKSTYHRGKFHPIDNKQKAPTLAVLQSVDGAVNHAITFFGEWVFDSNEEKALPICVQSLNRVAPPGYKDVLLAFRYGKGMCDDYPIVK